MTRAAMRAAERKSVPASRSGVNDAKALPKGLSWLFEGKWDGYRCLVLKDGRKHGKERAPTGSRARSPCNSAIIAKFRRKAPIGTKMRLRLLAFWRASHRAPEGALLPIGSRAQQ